MANHFILSCSLCELKYYSDESLSVVMETKKGKMIGCLLAQLSTATLLSLSDREQRQVTAKHKSLHHLLSEFRVRPFRDVVLQAMGSGLLLSLSLKDSQLGPNGVLYREVPLYTGQPAGSQWCPL